MIGQKNCTVAKRKPLVFRAQHETGHKNPRGRITLIGGKMNMLTMLLARILAGERYQPVTKEDSRIWISLLASFPLFLIAAFFTAPHTKDAALPLVWLSWVVGGLAFLATWTALFRTFQLPALGAIAFVGWITAFATAFYML